MAKVGSVEIPVELETKGFEAQIEQVSDELDKLTQEYEAIKDMPVYDTQQEDVLKYKAEIEKTTNKLSSLIDKQYEVQSSGTSAFGNIGNSLQKLGPKIAKIGITLLGARGIFGALSKATRNYLTNNEATAQKMSAIWVALGNLIGPIIEKIANLVIKLIGYINVFVKTVSRGKIDLTKNMGKNTKAIKGTTGAMKELNKQLAQFDEATVLQDQKLDSGGGAGGLDSDAFEMPELDETWVGKIQKFGEWVLENWPTILEVLGGIGLIFTAGKVAGWVSNIGKIIGIGGAGATGAGGSGLLGIATVVIALTALYLDLKGAIDKAADSAKQDFENRAKEGEKSKKVTEKQISILEDATASEKEHAEAVRNTNSQLQNTSKSVKTYAGNIKSMDNTLYEFGTAIGFSDEALRENKKLLKESTDKINLYVDGINKSVDAETLSKEEKEKYLITLQQERDDLRDARRVLNENTAEYKEVQASIKNVNSVMEKLVEGTDYQIDKFGDLKKITDDNNTSLHNYLMGGMSLIDQYNAKKIADKGAKIVIDANTVQAESALTRLANNVANSIQNAFSKLDLKSVLRNQIMKFPTDVTTSLKKVFGLARGGIVNMPGPGVPLTTNVVAGERGAEGVIPLTDAQMMETLGEAIGRYVTINANITNTMNGRVISRELQKISNESDFGSNR